MSVSETSDPIERQRSLYDVLTASQIARLGMVLFGAVGIWIAHFFWPTFFPYRYWYFSDTFWTDVLRFWPAFAWAGGLTALVAFSGRLRSTYYDEEFFVRGAITSIGAGTTEEAWYRGVGVFYFMVGLVILNWLWSAAGWLFEGLAGLGILLPIIGFVVLLFNGKLTIANIFGVILTVLVSAATLYVLLTFNHDPLYQLYNRIFYPIIDYVSFGLMHSVLYGPAPAFLVMGMISANFTFRDGHKYLGLFGYCNAWWIGCVFIFATLMYGLPVAIVVHALYDLEIDVIKYLGRKLRG